LLDALGWQPCSTIPNVPCDATRGLSCQAGLCDCSSSLDYWDNVTTLYCQTKVILINIKSFYLKSFFIRKLMMLVVCTLFNVIQQLIFHVQLLVQVVTVHQHPMHLCVIVNRVIFGMDNDVQLYIHLMEHVQDNMLVEQILFVI
jgi:hypothetical protein